MGRLGLVLVTAGVGALLVGPMVSHAVARWMGWRVTLPILLGYVPQRAALGRGRVTQRDFASGSRAVEPVIGLAFGLAAWRIGWSLSLLPVLLLATGMTAVSAVDLACGRIPTRFVYLTGIAALSVMALAALSSPAISTRSMTGAVVGCATYLGLLGVLHVSSPRQLGQGDVRLGAVIGLVVGWLGWSADQPISGPLTSVFQAGVAAGAIGLVVGLALRVARGSNRPYPFGPWLSLGAFVTILLGA